MNRGSEPDTLKQMGDAKPSEPGSVAADTLAAYEPLSARQRWQMVNAITARHLVSMVLCAGVAYLGFAAGQVILVAYWLLFEPISTRGFLPGWP